MRKPNAIIKSGFSCAAILLCLGCVPAFAQSASGMKNIGLRSTVNENTMPSMGLRSSFAPNSLQNANPAEYSSRGTAMNGDPSFRNSIHDPLMAIGSGFANSSTISASRAIPTPSFAPGDHMNTRVASTTMRTGPAIQNTVQASVVRKKRQLEDDPYAAIGLHWGAFMVYPAIELAGGLTSYKPASGGQGASGSLMRLLPELRLASLWARHALNINLRGGFEHYETAQNSERPFFEIDTAGQYDISATQNLQLGAMYRYDRETATSLDAQITGLPADVQQIQARGVYTQDFGYLRMALRSTFSHMDYQDSTSTAGTNIRNSDRSVFISDYALRGTYNRGTLISPFAEFGYNNRSFDNSRDSAGYARDSAGWRIRGGVSVAQDKVLSGEIAAGYLEQIPEDSRFVTLRAGIIDGNITWKPSALTTIIMAVSTDVNNSPSIGSSGYLSRKADLTIRHSLRRELILNAGFAYGQDAFQDINRTDNFYEIRGGADYFMNRFASIRALARYENRDSSLTGQSYSNTTIEARLRLQR